MDIQAILLDLTGVVYEFQGPAHRLLAGAVHDPHAATAELLEDREIAEAPAEDPFVVHSGHTSFIGPPSARLGPFVAESARRRRARDQRGGTLPNSGLLAPGY